MARSEALAETCVGAVVLAAAAGFLIYAVSHAGGASASGGYELVAKFGDVGALETGADVRVSGVKVGTVAKIELDPKNYLARVRMVVNGGLKLPSDSTAKITSSGLLGSPLIAIAPGGALDDLKPGGEIPNTQGAVDLFGLIGSVVKGGAATAPASTPAAKSQASPASAPAKTDPYPG